MPFWIEDPYDPDYGYNVDSASAYVITRRDDDGQVARIILSWEYSDQTFDGFLARQVHARIVGNLMKATDEPKAEGQP